MEGFEIMRFRRFSISGLLQTSVIRKTLLGIYAKRSSSCSFLDAIIDLSRNSYVISDFSLGYWDLIYCMELEKVFNNVTIQDLLRTHSQPNIQFSLYSSWIVSSILNLQDINNVTHELNKLSKFYKAVAGKIEYIWPDFSEDDRQELKELVYSLIAKNNSKRKMSTYLVVVNFFRSTFSALCTLIFYRNQLDQLKRQIFVYKEARQRCAEAQYEFIDAVLNEIEKEDLDYQQVLSDTLDELTSKGSGLNSVGVPIPEDTRGWLRSLSDKISG